MGARGNQTFVVVDELLVPEGAISQYKTFATSQVIGKYCIRCMTSYSPSVKPGSQYNATRAMRGIKCIRVRRNRLGFNSCVSCVHVLCRIVNQA